MKNRFLISILSLCLLVAVMFTGVGCSKNKGDAPASEQPAGEQVSFNTEDYITSPSQIKSIHTDAQLAFINGEISSLPSDDVNGKSEQSHPAAVRLDWDYISGASEYTVTISEHPDFSDSWTVNTIKPYYNLTNCKIRTAYWYKVKADNGTETAAMCFMTEAATPRNLNCDGITNMRDLGGYVTADNKIVKQDMIFRTGRLNKNSSTAVTAEITAKGKKFMLETLGVKTEIDLRQEKDVGCLSTLGEGTERSVLGKTVKYYNCAMEYDPSAYQEANYASVKQVFALLADEASYPLFFHCSIGTDRTGFIAYLIGGVLGVDKESLQRDYLFSNFGNIGGSRSLTTSSFTRYVDAIDNTAGATFAEKVENFLVRTIGVKKANIEKLRTIMLEDAVYEAGVVVKAPTATETGLMRYRCTSDPMKTYFAIMPATGIEADPVDNVSYVGDPADLQMVGIVALPISKHDLFCVPRRAA